MLAMDEDFETVLDNLEKQGHDMSAMREVSRAIESLPVGDPTPAPGTFIREPELIVPPAAVHQWWTDPPEKGIHLPPFGRPGHHHYNVGDLAKKLYRTRIWLTLLTMYALSVTVIAVVNW